MLTHWGRVTYICVSKLTIIGSDNGLSPGWRQAIIWTNAGILSIGTLETNFSEISTEIDIFSFRKMYLKMPSGNWRPFCLGLNVLRQLQSGETVHSNNGSMKENQTAYSHIFHESDKHAYSHITTPLVPCVAPSGMRRARGMLSSTLLILLGEMHPTIGRQHAQLWHSGRGVIHVSDPDFHLAQTCSMGYMSRLQAS